MATMRAAQFLRSRNGNKTVVHEATVDAQNNIDEATMDKLVGSFKTKMVRRMKVFHDESKRMDIKVKELLAKTSEMGLTITKMDMTSKDLENLKNFRKKTKALCFNIEAKRGDHEFYGGLNITPASMKLALYSTTLHHKSKNGFGLPITSITYYRTINVRDNYLTALVGGGTRIKDEDDF